MTTTIRYFYSYLSPYSYLADCRIEEALEPFDLELDYIPLVPPPNEEGERLKPRPEAEFTYILQDAPRVAKRFGLPFNPFDGYPDCAAMTSGFHVVRGLNGDWYAYHKACFAARFVDALDPAAKETLDTVARAGGIEPKRFHQALESSEFSEAETASYMKAVGVGLFGVPTFVLPSGERFWGQDRIEYLVLALEEGRT